MEKKIEWKREMCLAPLAQVASSRLRIKKAVNDLEGRKLG